MKVIFRLSRIVPTSTLALLLPPCGGNVDVPLIVGR
jgi:hypothetical protein